MYLSAVVSCNQWQQLNTTSHATWRLLTGSYQFVTYIYITDASLYTKCIIILFMWPADCRLVAYNFVQILLYPLCIICLREHEIYFEKCLNMFACCWTNLFSPKLTMLFDLWQVAITSLLVGKQYILHTNSLCSRLNGPN